MIPKAYYNEFDPKAAAWLRELIKKGLIADGDVDERSIEDVEARDIAGYSQCHWFAGIGGWSYALRIAGISDNEPVWTASLPCQPFSVAGKGLGKSDERHLLPRFIELVRQSKPKRLFGEQVAAAISHGWLDDLQAAMEAENYTCGFAVLGAHSVGAFHRRQRLYWVADSISAGLEKQPGVRGISRKANARNQGENTAGSCGMGIANSNGRTSRSETATTTRYRNPADSAGWSNPGWIECRDNKIRTVKPGIQCVVDGVSNRMVKLRGLGNAIVPQVAAEFISAFYEVANA